MLNYDEYKKLNELIKYSPDLEPIINKMSFISPSELSIDSHDIKNHIAYLKTSFQLLKKKCPELSDIKYFSRMENVLSELIHHMDRTTLYRYSMKDADISPVNINDILYEMPDIIDDTIDNDCSFEFNLGNIPDILINYDHLKMMLTEIILNACEASEYTGEITLYSEKCNTSEIHIKIINDTTVPASGFLHLEQMVQPFFSTRQNHCGVGLSIVHQICMKYNMAYSLTSDNNKTIFSIIIPCSTD